MAAILFLDSVKLYFVAIGSVFGKLLSFKESRADLLMSTSGLFQSPKNKIGPCHKVVCGEPRTVYVAVGNFFVKLFHSEYSK